MARSLKIPEGAAERVGGVKVTIGGENGTIPADYIVTKSLLYPGRCTYAVLIEFDERERRDIARGKLVWLCLEGAEVPWSLIVAD